ncbi:MAG: tetratricopeptide repeat protein [Vicinamibacterales bacterium]
MLRTKTRRRSCGVVHLAFVFFGVLLLAPSGAAAQNSVVSAAQALQAAGDLAKAAELLEAHLVVHPEDGEAARSLGQTLYWLHDLTGARRVYEASLGRHPDDNRLRLEYARMLAETGEPARARALITPLREVSGVRADALALLGTLAYWQGDLTSARTFLADALRANPEQLEARRMLQDIQAVTAPWLRVSPGMWHDDQPYTRGTVLVEAGWSATPLVPIRVRLQPVRYVNDALTETVWTADAELGHFAPRSRIETMVAGGVVHRNLDGARAVDWKGAAAVGVRLPRQVTLRARVDRAPYLATPASLVSNLMTRTASGELQWNNPRGWLGQAAFERQQFPDDNAIRAAYAWLLAPVVRQRRVELQAGYAFAADHADDSRFVGTAPPLPSLPGAPGSRGAGRRAGAAGAAAASSVGGQYAPYYTPSHVVKHSLLGAIAIRPGARTTLRVGGSYALRATEDAPSLITSAGQTQRTFAPRDFTAWDARSSLEFTGANGVTVGVGGQFGRGAFYRWATADVAITYRFLARPSTASRRR